LDVNDQLGLAEPRAQAAVLPFEVRHPFRQWVRHPRPTTPPAGAETLEGACLPLPPPHGQVRGVQALTAQQLTTLPRLVTGVGLLQDPQLVRGGELTPASLLGHLGVGDDEVGPKQRRGSLWPRAASGSSGLAALARGLLRQTGARGWGSLVQGHTRSFLRPLH